MIKNAEEGLVKLTSQILIPVTNSEVFISSI